ncbi:MAG TPA: DUF2852 domain-containing protein [Pseudolabrys sp.]|nr:DUF2852 domain-containing protein [Pseudolabrys sp.]
MSYAADANDRPQGPWGASRHGYYEHHHHWHPGLFILMILGFIFWWPMGLAMLAYIFWSKAMGGCWRHGSEHWQHKMDRMRSKMERFGGGFGGWGSAPSSGNRAFDEYRTETLRRLEEEQKEFRDFLDRLRFAKDKTEFDAFMAERRNRRPPEAPQQPPQS